MSPGAWRKLLPDAPRRRYTVHYGSNHWADWWLALGNLLQAGRDARAGSEDPAPEPVRRFELAAARRCGVRHAVAFGAGRMALYALLEAAGLEPGDEIVVPGFTCAVVANAMVYRGLVPVYADIEPRRFNLDAQAAAAAITPRTRALYLQHTFGQSADVAALRALAARHDLLLIEDAAHSLGAHHEGRPHGSLGTLAFFSSDRTKVINTHLGGVALTDDDHLAQRLRAVQQRSVAPSAALQRRLAFSFVAEFAARDPALLWLGRPLLGALRRMGLLFYWSDETADAIPAGYPYPSRLASGAARLGLAQLAALERNLAHRRAIARALDERSGWNADLRAGGRFDDGAWLRYSVRVSDRAGFVARFGAHTDLGLWFPSPIFGREGAAAAAVGYREGACPVAERVARQIVNLPTHERIPLPLWPGLWDRHRAWLQDHLLPAHHV